MPGDLANTKAAKALSTDLAVPVESRLAFGVGRGLIHAARGAREPLACAVLLMHNDSTEMR